MKRYTSEHVWLEEQPDGTLNVGITQMGNDAMGGLEMVTIENGKLCAESVKTAIVLDIPVKGTLVPIEAEGDASYAVVYDASQTQGEFPADKPLAKYVRFWEWTGDTLSPEEYEKEFA